MRFIVATALFTAACGVSAPDDGSPTLDSRVMVLPDLTGMIVDANAVTVPRENNGSLGHLAEGTILVSTHGEGFLREVDGVTVGGEAITIATNVAELSGAMIEGQVATAVGGDGKADTYQLPGFGVRFTDRVLLDNAVITAKLANGSLSFAPELQLDLAIADRSIESFAMIARGRISGSLDLDITAHQAAVGPEIKLWESAPNIFYQQVGVLPVVETVTTSLVLRLEATTRGSGRIHIDTDALARFEGGVQYTDAAGWDGVADASVTAHGSLPDTGLTFDQFGVRAWLAARVDVRLYGIAGPFIMVGPQAEASKSLNSSKVDASVGLRAGVGGGLKFLRFDVPASPTFDILDVTVPIL